MIETAPIRLLKDDARVWLINAGKGRRFMDEFIREKRLFLDLPGFNAQAKTFEDEAKVRLRLDRTWSYREHVRGTLASPPSSALADYSPYPFPSGTSESRAFSEDVGNILRLFKKAKKGDLVLIPRKGAFSPFLVGEITQKWSENDNYKPDKLAGYAVPSRKVRWLSSIITRADFPPYIGQRLINRHAVTEIKEEFYEEIFTKVYANFAWKDKSKLDVFGNGYTGKDPTQPYLAALLLKYVLSYAFAYEKGQTDLFNQLSLQSYEAAINQFYDESLVDELAQNFNSPGQFTFVGRRKMLSIFAAIGLALATGAAYANFDDLKADVGKRISGELDGSSTAEQEADAEIQNFLKSTEGSVWEPIQTKLGKPAETELGLTMDGKVQLAYKKARLEQ